MQTETKTQGGAEAAQPEVKKLTKAERMALKKAKAEKRAAAELKEGQALKKAEELGKNPKKKKDKATKTLTDTNASKVVATITVEKDLKYIYPQDCQEGGTKEELLERRKKFRAGVRRKVEAFEKQMKVAMASDKPTSKEEKEIRKVEKEYKAYAKEVYVTPTLVKA